MIFCVCIWILLWKYAVQVASDPAGPFLSLISLGVWQKQLRATILPDWSRSVKGLRRKHPRSLACVQANSYNSRMFDTHRFLLFFAAALVLAVTPGPGIFYVLARSLAGGRREGLQSSYGTFAGGLFHVLAAALGISAILAASATAFHSIKYAGAAYLVWLGIRMIRTRNEEMTVRADQPSRGAFRQGIFTEVLNPKTALFFLSFIPQFVTPARGHVFLQFVALGTISVVMNTTADLLVIALAGPLGNRIRTSATFRRRQRTLTGAIMIGLGTYLATSESK